MGRGAPELGGGVAAGAVVGAGGSDEKADSDPHRVVFSMGTPVGECDADDKDGCKRREDIDERRNLHKVKEDGHETSDSSKELQGGDRACVHIQDSLRKGPSRNISVLVHSSFLDTENTPVARFCKTADGGVMLHFNGKYSRDRGV